MSPPIHYYRNLFGSVGDPKLGGGGTEMPMGTPELGRGHRDADGDPNIEGGD